MSDVVAGGHGSQPCPAGSHGLGTWLFVVAIPASEACDDPGQPGEGLRRMRIFLPLGLAFERRPDVLGGLNDLWACNVARGSIAAVTRIDQLDCSDGRRHGLPVADVAAKVNSVKVSVGDTVKVSQIVVEFE